MMPNQLSKSALHFYLKGAQLVSFEHIILGVSLFSYIAAANVTALCSGFWGFSVRVHCFVLFCCEY
jgi:hypothetical protein